MEEKRVDWEDAERFTALELPFVVRWRNQSLNKLQSHFQQSEASQLLRLERYAWMHYAGVRAGETTVRLLGHCNPLRLSLSAYLYLYSKCHCINGCGGGEYCYREEESEGGRSGRETELARQGVCVPWESGVSSLVKAGGFTGRNRCLLSAPVGLLCNNRPVTLRKCREAACVCL